MDFLCKYCGKVCKNNNSLAQHEIRCLYNENHVERKQNTDLEDLSYSEKKLLNHYIYLYPEEYKSTYLPIKDNYYSLGYKKYDASKLAKRDTLKKLIEVDEKAQLNQGVWSCPVCGLHIKDMGAHIEKIHNIQWDVFVDEYNWTGSKIFFTRDHRKNLSKNKLRFYNETEKGKILKSIQSKKVSGNNNPACSDEVKLKISKSRSGQHITTKTKYNISKSLTSGLYSDNAKSYGYTFWAFVNGIEKRFRSKTEYLIFLMFDYYKIDFEYEPYKIEYIDSEYSYPRHYIVDFISNQRLFEVKPHNVDFSKDKKYINIQNQLLKVNKKLELLTPSNFMELLNIPLELQKPISFFNNLIIDNIKNGNCKLVFPIAHDRTFYINSSFIKSLGENPEKLLERGKNIYENKKNSRNL